jgi:hypothetical protein
MRVLTPSKTTMANEMMAIPKRILLIILTNSTSGFVSVEKEETNYSHFFV